MAGDDVVTDRRAQLQSQILADRFEVIDGPLGWRCLGCGAEVRAVEVRAAESGAGNEPTAADVARLSETAADHALFCGRCDD